MKRAANCLFAGFVVLALGSIVSGMENNIIISKGYVSKLCIDRCQSSETELVEDCERGCRFFEYAETADLVDFNETAFHLLCVSNCNEAYVVEKNRGVCVSGCNFAKKEVDNIMEMSHHLLEEAEKQMNFLNSIIGMVSSTFWSTEDNENDVPKDLQHSRVSGQLLDLLGDIPTRGNKLDDKFSAGDVEIINLMGDDMSSVDPAEMTLCATRLWLHRLSFILIVMGSISLLFISIFYLLAFMKHKKSKEIQETTDDTGDLTSLNPPSYETLIKSGYIVEADNYMAPPLNDEKKEKIFAA
ncbi:hypothetical protein DAPPUDRAFT_303171 [Daphnia pulex]|uniref:Uncharacterized protein n=1 Tax=Daphnia pulex TaxID=6669 RepID=E9FTA2_DAPPU|nr:hypothetical protein DAPPUDRAFT_303171 [Daphnia pulex]|eukprot:EFX89681.1 hypothetical protein DAPPUDRAFT_303171 [Daphnia pulex]